MKFDLENITKLQKIIKIPILIQKVLGFAMKKFSKEEDEFLTNEIHRLSKQYPTLDIFNRKNNPYLVFKGQVETTKEYKEIQNKKEWWQNHILKILEQSKPITLFTDRNEKENYDILLFVLISLYFEIPIAYEFHYMYNKLKELDKEYLPRKNKAIDLLDNVREEIERNIYPYLNLRISTKKSQKEHEKFLRISLNRLYRTIDEATETIKFITNHDQDFKYINTMNFSYNYNEVWTRNLLDKTGLRQIVLRQIALLLDLIYHEQYKAFNKPSYQLLESVMPYDNNEISMMHNLTQEDVYKIIKGISYYDDYKNYSHAFEGFTRYYKNNETSLIEPHIKQWEENQLSYQVFNKVIQELIEIDKWSDKADLE